MLAKARTEKRERRRRRRRRRELECRSQGLVGQIDEAEERIAGIEDVFA